MSTTQTSAKFALPTDAHRPIAHRKRTTPCTRRNSASFRRHARKCTVCKHKERAEIELDFLHWHTASNIAADHGLETWAIYRHAHASGLFEERMLNMRYAAIHIVEWADSVKPSAMAVLHAMRACTLINDEGKWIDPPKRIVIERRNFTDEVATDKATTAESGATGPSAASSSSPTAPAQPPTPPSAQPPARPAVSTAENPNRNFHLLENGATPTKQTTDTASNRNSYDKNSAPAAPE